MQAMNKPALAIGIFTLCAGLVLMHTGMQESMARRHTPDLEAVMKPEEVIDLGNKTRREPKPMEFDYFKIHGRETNPMSIEDFKKDWEKHGVPVVQLDSLDDFQQEFASEDWKSPGDISGPSWAASTGTPLSGSVPLQNASSTSEHIYLYHGGDIRTEYFKGGANTIDFEATVDMISGPAFFTTHNAFFASFYGQKGQGSVTGDGTSSGTGYLQVLQLELSPSNQCVGLFPHWKLIQDLAKLNPQDKAAKIKEECGTECSFLTINWNKDDSVGGGLLPYEFRLLPASIQKCGVRFRRVFAIKFDDAMKYLFQEFTPKFKKAFPLFGELVELNQAQYA